MKFPSKIILAACALIASASLNATADTAITFSGTPTNPAATGIVGFDFTVTSAISVNALAFFASSIGNGDHPHVSIYNISGAPLLVADTGDLNGTALTNNAYNFINLATPVTLTPGVTYQLTTPIYFSQDYAAVDVANFVYGTAISSQGYYLNAGFGGWHYPPDGTVATTAQTTDVKVGANFTYSLASVPEPSAYGIIGVGLIGLCVMRRVKLRVQA